MEFPASPLIGPEQYSPEWYRLRLHRPDEDAPVIFGASEAGMVMNSSPYGQQLDLALRKWGKADVDENRRMWLGTRFEPIILDWYEEELAARIADGRTPWEQAADFEVRRGIPLLISRDWPWLAASPDAVLCMFEEPRMILEAKFTGSFMRDKTGSNPDRWGEEESEEVPLDYFWQGQQQMAVTGLHRVEFPVLFDGRNLKVYAIERDEQSIMALVEVSKELARKVHAKEKPPVQYDIPGAKDCVQRYYGRDPGAVKVLDESAADAWDRLEAIKKDLKMLDKEKEKALAEIEDKMEGADFGSLPGGNEIKRITIKESVWTETDVVKAQQSLGEVKRKGYSYFK